MGTLTLKGNSICFQRREEVAVIEPYGPDCIRFRSTRNRTVSDEAWTLLPPQPAPGAEVLLEGHAARLRNGRIEVTVDIGDGWPVFDVSYRHTGTGKQLLRTIEEKDYVTRYRHVAGNLYQVKAVFAANEGERLYGLGQEQQDYFDRKGCAVDLCHWNTKSTIPVLYSSLGYGFIWNNPSPGRCETAKNHTLWCAEEAYQIDYLIFAGDTPAQLVNTYCELTGYAPRIPQWALGFWQCKLRYESQDEILDTAREYRRRGIPIDAIVIDYFHWTEQGDWKFDPRYWPDPEEMCRELREMGIEPVVSIWPTINPHSENWREMSEGNLLITNENGQYGMFDFYGQQAFIDPTNPAARRFVWEKVRENYYRKGIRTFWLDEAEPEVHPQQFSNLRLYAGNGGQAAMLYPFYYAKAFYEGLKEEGEQETIALTRAAWLGSQRFGVSVWNGDISSTFDALRQSIISGLSMSLCGIPWWNSDIGGFHSGDIESEEFRELIVRWFQFGVFCPIMRLHGSRRRQSDYAYRHPGIIEPSGGDNELWSFGERNYPILKSLIELRERLRPYLTRMMEENCASGAPIMRPMFYQYPQDDICYDLDDQYMFGSDILFAPIIRRGQTSRKVYLPEGTWILTRDGRRYTGGWTEVSAAVDEFIAFVPEGSEVLSAFQ